MRALAIVVLGACGGGSGGFGTDEVTDDQKQTLCTQGCQHDVECDGDTLDGCVADCVGDTTGWRADALAAVVHCIDGLSCADIITQCFLVVEPLAIHRQYEDTCRTAFASCVAMPSDLDDVCAVSPDAANGGPIRMLAPAIVSELIACFDAADCVARDACLRDTFVAHGVQL